MTGRPHSMSLLRWPIAFTTVVLAHGAIVWAAAGRKPENAASASAPPAILIDLAAAPENPPLDVAPGPETPQSEAQPELEQKPVEETQVEPKPDPSPPKEAEVVLPASEPKREEPKPKPKKKASTAMATPTFQARRGETAASQAAGAAQAFAVSPASWKNDLLVQLNRHKRYPSGASGTGTAIISFNINRSGQVTSARLIRSSSDRALDNEAVSLPRRAGPLPPPPAGIGGASIGLNVPIRFGR